MEFVVASALLQVLFEKVTDTGIDGIAELKKIKGSDVALESLKTTILEAQNLLNQVYTFELKGNIKNVMQERVDKLIELCYSTEDMMDDRHSSDGGYDGWSILLSPKNWKKSRIIDDLKHKLDAILKELKVLKELIRQQDSTEGQPKGYSKLNLEKTLPLLRLRDNEVEAIVLQLISSTSKSKGVSIIGTGGIGKTKVALTIKDEPSIVKYFPCRLWVPLAGDFKADNIVHQLDQIHAKWLCANGETLSQQSILVIFDNLLEVKLHDWNVVWTHIRTNGINKRKYENIKLLITTYNSEVAKHTGSISNYLKPLCDDKCQEVIIATATYHNEKLFDKHLRHAKLLAEQCGGMPSVATILGVFLALYKDDDVQDILDNDLWDSDLFKEQIFPALKSCYKQIHAQLKSCLAYFSLFPEDHAFAIDELVQLWVGE